MTDPQLVGHLYRRAGFGLASADVDRLAGTRGYRDLVDSLLVFDPAAVDVDAFIGTPGYVGVTSTGPFSPNQDIGHARQRWLFRLVHAGSPLTERMALVWHHHFATAYSKIQGIYGSLDATRLMAAVPTADPAGQRGQIELFRQYAFGSFADLLVEVAMDPAMLVWLDGRLNTKRQPQENFGRELMELFTFGVEHYTEADVYSAARVFTGWNLQVVGQPNSGNAAYRFLYRADQHDAGEKTFSFPLSGWGRTRRFTIPAQPASLGIQEGIDLIRALAYHPETARRMARRLWTWFVSETTPPDPVFVTEVARVYLESGTNMRAVLRAVLMSPQFRDSSSFYQRYSWPAEFVARAVREIGPLGFSVGQALTPMLNMGQQLFEPPDVNGWDVGPGWFSTGGVLARLNFGATLAASQRVALREASRPFSATPDTMVDFGTHLLSVPTLSPAARGVLTSYVASGSAWTGSESQLLAKAAGLVHLLVGSSDYQVI